jgi:hypothetical protein
MKTFKEYITENKQDGILKAGHIIRTDLIYTNTSDYNDIMFKDIKYKYLYNLSYKAVFKFTKDLKFLDWYYSEPKAIEIWEYVDLIDVDVFEIQLQIYDKNQQSISGPISWKLGEKEFRSSTKLFSHQENKYIISLIVNKSMDEIRDGILDDNYQYNKKRVAESICNKIVEYFMDVCDPDKEMTWRVF